MDIIDIILLATALGIDCLIISFSQGLIFKLNRKKNSLKLALTMGLFQGLMPVIGYIATDKIYNLLIPYSKWIVFTLFLILGLHFISEGFWGKEKEQIQCIGFKCLIALGIATSIDALISGVSIKLTSANLLLSCGVIGLASFLMSQIGFWTGNVIKNIPSKHLHIIGGIILISLAIKNLIL